MFVAGTARRRSCATIETAALVFQNAPQSRDAIAPTDLLSFGERAPQVMNRTFVEPDVSQSEQSGRDFQFDSKPLFTQRGSNFLNQGPPNQLVTGFDIREFTPVSQAKQLRNQLIHGQVPQRPDLPIAATEPAALDHPSLLPPPPPQ